MKPVKKRKQKPRLPKGLRKLRKHLNGFIDGNQFPRSKGLIDAVFHAQELLAYIEEDD